tara:strand:- start:1566 stop:1757 length:192 start_codon:yes stop_codon:yes gene_type:complete
MINSRTLLCFINKKKIIVSASTNAVNYYHYEKDINRIILLSPSIVKKYTNDEIYNYIKNSKLI